MAKYKRPRPKKDSLTKAVAIITIITSTLTIIEKIVTLIERLSH